MLTHEEALNPGNDKSDRDGMPKGQPGTAEDNAAVTFPSPQFPTRNRFH